MAKEALASTLVDPLANYWGLSLFPHTSTVPPSSSMPYNPDVDLDAIHNHLRSMALGSPSKLLKQAKSIIDGNPRLGNSEAFGDSAHHVISDISKEASENPRERRPALGHKRARFSLKPNRKEVLKPSIDIDNIKDPEEFFKAVERLENAEREIQKQMGNVLFEPNQNNTSTNSRQRRLGLMGNSQRRPVRYKHRYSVETFGQKEDIPLSQGEFESGSLDPIGERPEKDEDEAHPASPRSELANSSTMKEKNHNKILDELLHNSEDLEEDQAITLLQESLQIKPIVLEKLSIPDLPENRVTELKTFVGTLSKPRKPLMNIDNLLREMNNATPEKHRQNVANTWQQLASPTPPRSPFALLPSLQKRLSQSKPSVDSFSTLDRTYLSPRNSPQSDKARQELKLGKPSDKLDEPLIKDIQSSVEKTVRNFATTSGISGEDNSGKPAFGPNIDSGSCLDLEVDARGRNMNKVIDDIVSKLNSEAYDDDPNSKEENSTEPAFGPNVVSNISHGDMEVEVGGIDVDDQIVHDKRSRVNEPDESAGKAQEAVFSEQTTVPEFNLVNPQDQSGDAFFEANFKDGNANTSDDDPRQILQAQENTVNSQVPVNKRRKVKSRKPKDKGLSRRQSLAVAGTSWKSGVRRSTRMRSRPLEYWKGERPLYGRIHESLVTLIGVKHMSPGTADGKPKLKVKSYVDNEKYKELLDLA